MSFPRICFVFADRFLAMHVALPLNLVVVHSPLISSGSITSKGVGSKEIDESATRAAVERVYTSFPIYEDTKLIIDKDIKLK